MGEVRYLEIELGACRGCSHNRSQSLIGRKAISKVPCRWCTISDEPIPTEPDGKGELPADCRGFPSFCKLPRSPRSDR